MLARRLILSPAVRIALITALLGAESLVALAWQAPDQRFVRFVAMDSGGELAIQDLIRQGLLPGIDFGYPYGLFALLIGRLWYAGLGLTATAYQILVAVGILASCWGLARLIVARGVGWVGLLLVALAIPDLIFVTYLTSVQTIEQALLIHALAEQARGRRGAALAVLAACCFVKPSLAFVQGLLVLILTCTVGIRGGWANVARTLAPAAIMAAILALVLAVSFSPLAVATTLSPARGASIYRANHYGFFFGQGRAFWVLPGAGLRDYFRYEVGFWLLGTGCLAGGLVVSVWHWVSRRFGSVSGTDDELILVCGGVHLAFVCLLFGHRWTWVYSLPMLIVGLAVLAQRGPRVRALVLVLAGLLLISDRSKAVAMAQRRQVESTSLVTLGLWATTAEQAEWAQVLALTQDQKRRPVLYAMCEGGAILFPCFARPTAAYLVPGNMLPVEVERKAHQLAEAELIVTYGLPDSPDFEPRSRLNAAFADCDRIFRGKFVQVYRRRSSVLGLSQPD